MKKYWIYLVYIVEFFQAPFFPREVPLKYAQDERGAMLTLIRNYSII